MATVMARGLKPVSLTPRVLRYILVLFFLGRETLVSLGENEKAISFRFPFERKKRGGSKLLKSVKRGPESA
jgi:hypothetical protein